MSKILVTGGLGFIGSNFISKYISKGHFLVNIDSKTYASIDKSLLNIRLPLTLSAKIAWVFNCLPIS